MKGETITLGVHSVRTPNLVVDFHEFIKDPWWVHVPWSRSARHVLHPRESNIKRWKVSKPSNMLVKLFCFYSKAKSDFVGHGVRAEHPRGPARRRHQQGPAQGQVDWGAGVQSNTPKNIAKIITKSSMKFLSKNVSKKYNKKSIVYLTHISFPNWNNFLMVFGMIFIMFLRVLNLHSRSSRSSCSAPANPERAPSSNRWSCSQPSTAENQ